MNAKFTKDSWVVGEHKSLNDGSIDIKDSEENLICSLYFYRKTEDQQKANAQLIACAPDMYAEIERDIECLTRWIDNHGDAFPMTAAWKDMRANKIELLKRVEVK